MEFLVVRRRRYWLAGIVASLALLLGGAAFVQVRAEDGWSSMQRTVRALREKYDARPFQREPLWGDATDGSAFAHYARADAAARQLQKDHHLALLKLLPHADGQVATEATELRAAWQPVLMHLRAGAHASDVRPTTTPEAEPKEQILNLLDGRWVANAAIFESRALRHEGRAIEAVHWSLDAATYAVDQMRGSVLINHMIGVAILAIATNEAWRDDAALRSLSPAALEELAAGLERVDASLPEVIDFTHELLLCAKHLQEATADADWMPSAWAYGFSTRWMISDAFLQYAAATDDWLGARDIAWPQRSAMFEAAGEDFARSRNPLALTVIPNLSAAEFNVRDVIARLRMLRMAVGLHRGIDAPPLRDPLGNGPLIVTRADGRVHIASAASGERRKIERVVAH